jgi:uncharacterized repeat protein (TIGR01451 family)
MASRTPASNEFIGLGSAIVTVNAAEIDVTKTPNVTQACVPGDVTYTFVVSNPGTIALENVTVTDNVLGDLTATFVAANGGSATLAAGATVNFQVVHAAALGAVTNTVTASGTALGVTATDTATATVTGETCDIDVTKTPNVTQTCVPGDVTYTFVVSNPGTIALENVTVTDDVLGDLTATFTAANGGSATLAAGGSVNFQVVHAAALGAVTNTVTASGVALGVTATDTATATVTGETCDIDVTKTPNVTQTCVPGDVTYTFVVSNPGTVALTNVTVSDDVLGDLTATFVAANGASSTLAAGASVNFQVVHAAALGAVTNTVTASGVALGVTATATANATVTGVTCDIEITKTPNVTQTCVPGDVTYTFVVSNPGTIALENVTVTDDVLGDLTATFTAANGGSATLAAGATVNFQVVHAAALGAVTNTVTASGTALGVTATDTATATVTGETCDIDVTKTPNVTQTCVPGDVTYTFVVSNPGTIALENVTVTDDVLGDLTATFVAPTVLAARWLPVRRSTSRWCTRRRSALSPTP